MNLLDTKITLGRIEATPCARDALARSGEDAVELLDRHACGDWGDADPELQIENDIAVQQAGRVVSCYATRLGHYVWIVTDGDRSLTTLMTRDEL